MKTLSPLLFTVLVLTLSACGGGSGSSSSPTDNTGNNTDTPTDAGDQTDTPSDDQTDTPTDDQTDTPTDDSSDDSSNDSSDDQTSDKPNILLIIADDQGLDASAQYSYSADVPSTPSLNAIAADGLVFDNAWVTPSCATTRATIITGKYGHNSGIITTPGELDTSQQTLPAYLAADSASSDYASAVFGKWHIGGNDANHPSSVGVQHYAGNLRNLDDYFDWELTENGVQTSETSYHTSKITDLAINWIGEQSTPWFAWIAYAAPHSPLHLPPNDLHSRDLSGTDDDIAANPREYFLAMIEAMDTEIGRLLDSLDETERANTTVIYIGDNGTSRSVIDNSVYTNGHQKGSLYQGGIAVPLVIGGNAVSRKNQRETALVTGTDLFATIGQLAGIETSQIHDSTSFASLLTDDANSDVSHVFTEYEDEDTLGWAIRTDTYKLIEYETGVQELYDISTSFEELNDLINSADPTIVSLISELNNQAAVLRGETSNGSGTVDITDTILSNTSGNCADYANAYESDVTDIENNTQFNGDLVISVLNGKCIFNTNVIPNHDFNDTGGFANNVSAQDVQLEITATPSHAASVSEIGLRQNNAVMLNGVKVDIRAAACYGVGGGTLGSEKVGCGEGAGDWRYDPIYPPNGFNVDSHNAHAQPDGTYHYHASPLALFDDSDNSQVSPVIGFAADGYPIFGSFFNDGTTIRKALSSYQLKAGTRPTGDGEPGEADGPFAGESYNGRFIQDYEYVADSGDLDECNGMEVNGVYGYYITDSFPYVIGCFSGTPDSSFDK